MYKVQVIWEETQKLSPFCFVVQPRKKQKGSSYLTTGFVS